MAKDFKLYAMSDVPAAILASKRGKAWSAFRIALTNLKPGQALFREVGLGRTLTQEANRINQSVRRLRKRQPHLSLWIRTDHARNGIWILCEAKEVADA